MSRSRWLVGGALGAVLLISAACGSSGSASSTTSTAGSSATNQGSTAGSATASVKVATVGSVGAVLVNSAGMTLYRYSPDGTGKPMCTGACATIWPALTVPAGTVHVTGGSGLTAADLGTTTRSDGTLQVTYKGMPLYTYSNDTKAGDAAGQGVGGIWFVITSGSSARPSAPTTTKASTGGYGY